MDEIHYSQFLGDDLDFSEIENLLFEDTMSPGDVFERNFSDINPRDERNDESHQTEQQATTSVQNYEIIDVNLIHLTLPDSNTLTLKLAGQSQKLAPITAIP